MTKQQTIYLDYAAATPVSSVVFEEMKPYLMEKFFNPSAIYLDAKVIKQDIDDARHSVAQILGARPDEIVFTAGATESCNLAIKGVMGQYSEANIIFSAIEHSAVSESARSYENKIAPVDSSGLVDLAQLKTLIDDKTALVSIIYANNEIGVIQNLSEISRMLELVRQERKAAGNDLPIWLHSDGAQAGSYLDLHVSRLGVDLFTLNGGKMYGPKQSGILYLRGGVRIKPQIDGGGQEWGSRSGTENVANIVGFAAALKQAQQIRKDESYRLSQIQNYTIKQLQNHNPEIVINGSTKHRLPNNVNFSVSGLDGERMVMMLDEAGVQCSTGAACSALSDESSHVIKALGRTEDEARGSIRLSFGRETTEEQINEFLSIFKQL